MRASYVALGDGDAGTQQTLDIMRDVVRARVGHPLVREVAVNLARTVPPRDRTGQVRAIREYLTEHVLFLADPLSVEALHDPVMVLRDIARRVYVMLDCDDVAILGAALGGAIGLPSRFVVLGFHDRTAPMSHVYAELFDGAAWVDLDTTRNLSEIDRARMIARSWTYPVLLE